MSPPNSIGQIIKEIRLQKKLIQKDLAEKSGLTAANLSRIESGKAGIARSTLNSILIALDLPPVEQLIHEATMNSTEIQQIWNALSAGQKTKLKSYAKYLLKEGTKK